MKIEVAEHLIDFVKTKAAADGLRVYTTILDAGAHLMAFHRMDGVPIGPIDVSRRKAMTAALFQTDSIVIGADARPGQPAYTLEHSNGGLIAFGGGVVLYDKAGTFIGAIGVGGATVEQDQELAASAAASLLA